jgi:hypothetical protein
MAETNELRERLARLENPSANGGGAAAPSADDLDWFLFQSFPDCEVSPERFASLLPKYEHALRAGVPFDSELLYVRVLEIGGTAGGDARRAIARTVAERVLAGQLDSSDSIAAVRFAVRVLPDAVGMLDRLRSQPELRRLYWQMTVDFVLDERPLGEYLAVSYLRDDDPDAGPRLRDFPVPPEAQARLEEMFAPEACRRRLEEGFEEFAEPEERGMLLAAFESRVPGFRVG